MKRQQLEFNQYISPDGKVYDFDNKVDKFIYPMANLGMAPIRYITQRGPFQNDVMTILEMEALLWSGEEYSVRMERTEEVEQK